MSLLNPAVSILQNPLVLLFGLLSAAYGVDRLSGSDGRLYPVVILIVAPVIGWLGHFALPAEVQILGLVMFVYVVGLESGTEFFPTFRLYWRRFLLVGSSAALLAGGVVWCASEVLHLPATSVVAAYSGAMTNTAVFNDALRSLNDPAGMQRLFDLCYFVAVLTAVAGIGVAHTLWTRRTVGPSCPVYFDPDVPPEPPYFVSVHRCVNTHLTSKPYENAIARGMEQSIAVRVRRNGSIFDIQDDTICEMDDVVLLVSCSPRLPDKARVVFGPSIELPPDDPLLKNLPIRFETVVVTGPGVTTKPLLQQEVKADYGVEIRGWWRGPEFKPARKRMQLRYGDRLRVLGTKENIREFRQVAEADDGLRNEEIDLLRFSAGAVAGLVLGGIALSSSLGVWGVTLGATGGPLLAGLLFGRSAAVRIPRGAGFFLKELGLGLFLAGVGISAGRQGSAVLDELWVIPVVFLAVALPMILTGLLLKGSGLGDQYIEGGVGGSVTNAPALIVSCKMTNTSEPATTFAGVYFFALATSIAITQLLCYLGRAG